jgi:hypothetical protein
MHEGTRGGSIDPVFINALLKKLKPSWVRQAEGSNLARLRPCHGRIELIEEMPKQLKACLAMGGHTTLMVWADCDHDHANGDELKATFRNKAAASGISHAEFEKVVFVFAKDRLENWVEFLATGKTDESLEGPRVKSGRAAADAAKKLAEHCLSGAPIPNIPPSLDWSCRNWKALKESMRQ